MEKHKFFDGMLKTRGLLILSWRGQEVSVELFADRRRVLCSFFNHTYKVVIEFIKRKGGEK